MLYNSILSEVIYLYKNYTIPRYDKKYCLLTKVELFSTNFLFSY